MDVEYELNSHIYINVQLAIGDIIQHIIRITDRLFMEAIISHSQQADKDLGTPWQIYTAPFCSVLPSKRIALAVDIYLFIYL